jgi:hypothetical protein
MKNFTYVNPSSVEEASELLKQPGTVVMGGGTDLLGVLKDGLLPEYPEKVVSLKKLPGMIRSEKKKTVCILGQRQLCVRSQILQQYRVAGMPWLMLQEVLQHRISAILQLSQATCVRISAAGITVIRIS